MATHPLTPMVRLTGIALIVAGIGIGIEYLSGVPGFPTVPPGPIICIVVGVVVLALTPKAWWIGLVGAIVAIAELVGSLVGGSSIDFLGHPGQTVTWIGSIVQWAGLVVGAIAGVLVLVQYFQSRSRAAA